MYRERGMFNGPNNEIMKKTGPREIISNGGFGVNIARKDFGAMYADDSEIMTDVLCDMGCGRFSTKPNSGITDLTYNEIEKYNQMSDMNPEKTRKRIDEYHQLGETLALDADDHNKSKLVGSIIEF